MLKLKTLNADDFREAAETMVIGTCRYVCLSNRIWANEHFVSTWIKVKCWRSGHYRYYLTFIRISVSWFPLRPKVVLDDIALELVRKLDSLLYYEHDKILTWKMSKFQLFCEVITISLYKKPERTEILNFLRQ